jgi:hypothetical protein
MGKKYDCFASFKYHLFVFEPSILAGAFCALRLLAVSPLQTARGPTQCL